MKSEIEIWKDIPNYEGLYQCSNLGRIKSLSNEFSKKEKILKPQKKDGSSYYRVILWKNSKIKSYRIHKVVAMVFLNHVPNGMIETVDHINGDKFDNRVSNLQLLTSFQNQLKHHLLNKSNTTSKYIGVYYHKRHKRWYSKLNVNSKQIHIGSFLTEIEAHNGRNNYINDNNLVLTPIGYKKKI